jgi:nicotinamide mononucleotide transporter
MSWIEMIAVVLTALGVWLQARRSLLNFPANLLGVALYLWIFFDARLYSDMLLQVFFAATLCYGWIQWTRGVIPDGTVAVVTPSTKEISWGVAAGLAGIGLLGYPMAHYTNAAAPWLDATLTSFSLVANLWLARCYLINWWLWIALDVIYVGLYSTKHLYLTAGLYAFLMALCSYALVQWQRAAKEQGRAAARVPSDAAVRGAASP